MSAWVDCRVQLDGGSMGWREQGQGQPLVFLHGLGGTRSSWNPQLTALSDDRRCIAWDMPGYGDSTGPDELTYEHIADRLVELLDHLEIERADMVGLSFGGMHILHTALRHPGRVGAIVLADTSPAFGMDGTQPDQWKADRLSALAAGETPATMAASVLDAIVAQPLGKQIRRDLIESFARIPVEGFRAAVECLPHNDLRSRLTELTNPALVIVGELDEETPQSYAQVLADGLPTAVLTVLQGVGHLSPSEKPQLFNDHVRDFLDRHPNGAPS